jgi:hypothetical protein
VTDEELEHTRSVERPRPPKLVEPPARERGDRLPDTSQIPVMTSSGATAAAVPGATTPVATTPAAGPAGAKAAPAAPEPRRPYRLKMADGVVVSLDLTVYLGRRPSVPRIASDRRVRLVAVPSMAKEVSATHLELRQNGEAIVATDMRSTNGSTVTVPGSSPRTLLRGESAVVTPGTLIDLGDGNVLEVLSPERVTEQAAP